ncbi:MAG: D-aminoacyl-tRNA deacylase [Brevinema sp.]
MTVIVRRVLSASVEVNHKTVSSIGEGLLLYVGFAKEDTKKSVDYAAKKIAGLRIFDSGEIEVSVQGIKAKILSISQFTLSADISKGFRPSYGLAMPSSEAKELYDYFNQKLHEESSVEVHTGVFGADMKIHAVDDGPFTILIEC